MPRGHAGNPKKKITLEFLLTFYEYFLRNQEMKEVARALNTTINGLKYWIKKFPVLQKAKALAEKRRAETGSIGAYIFKHLSPEAKKIWDRVQYHEEEDDGNEHIRRIMSGRSIPIKQEIFLYAMIHYGWNISEGARVANVSRQTVEDWKQSDDHFRDAVNEIEEHKCNFFEQALCNLVAAGNPGAVMFVNRTKNADRGYTERVKVEHSGNVNIGITLDELDLPLEIRKVILQAMREKKAQQNAISAGEGEMKQIAGKTTEPEKATVDI